MRDLTDVERTHLERLNKLSFRKHTSGYFCCEDSRISRTQIRYKRSRIKIMLYLGKWLELWEIVHHKDGNKENDDIDNLEVLNTFDFNVHASNHNAGLKKKFPDGWKPVHALRPEAIERIKELANEMREIDSRGKVNYSEIARRLNKEGIKICDATVGRYLK